MAQKPNFKEIKELVKYAAQLDSWMKSVLEEQDEEVVRLRRAAEAFYSDQFRRALEEVDVEILSRSKLGIRIGCLRSAGITNLSQLSRMSVAQLEALDGIGQQGAIKIYSTTQQIVENTRSKLRLRIHGDAPTPAEDALIRAVYILLLHTPIRQEIEVLYRRHHQNVQSQIAAAKLASGGLRWLFSSEKKKQTALNASAALRARILDGYGDRTRIDRYNSALQADGTEYRAHFRDNAAAYYSVLEQYCKQLDTSERSGTGLSKELLEQIEAQPIDLQYMKATLRGYQLFGVKYAVHQGRTLLGDEMGLGKTIQAVAAMAALKAAGKHHFMVVCPASVLINWCREIKKHSSLEVTKVHGADEQALRHWRENGDIAVTTFESISRFALPQRFTFDMLVVDEAHYVKNPQAQRTVAMGKLLEKTERVLYMSGTPLVNRVEEMCFLVQCLQPDIAKRLEQVKDLSTAEQFRQELAPVYLRRVREEVLSELPDLIEKEQWCRLSPQESSMYREAVASGNLMAIRQVSWQMAELTDSSKAMRLKEICENAKEQGRKVIVFSFFRNTLEKVHKLLGERCMETISGEVSPARRQEIVDTFNNAPPGAVLVSQVQAGGTGLNIQAASVVVFCEPQLTPAIESQAIARAYRMGQTRDVQVHRLLADDTIDERMLELLSGKQQAFDSFADESVIGDKQLQAEKAGSWVTQMVQEEQRRLQQV